jgi:tetratricopeptide (TPR) repeat protein
MPFDDEKMRLETRLLGLLQQALQDRNRDEIVSATLALGDLYLSGDLYEKAEEYFRRVLEEPVAPLAHADEKARAQLNLALVLLRRGHLTLAREGLKKAREAQVGGGGGIQLEARRLHCELELHAGRYREVVDAVESTLSSESPEKLGDLRVDFMILEGRARRLMGRNRQSARLLEKALDLAQKAGYEAGTGAARSELGRLLTALGRFKPAHDHLEAALKSDEGMASQRRLNADRIRLALLQTRMGRWKEAESLADGAFQSSREIGNLEGRVASQLVRAGLKRLHGSYDDAYDFALDAMEAARSAGYVRRHVEGLVSLAQLAHDRGQAREAMELLREAEVLYGRLAPESNVMLQIHLLAGRVHDLLGETPEAFDRLMRAHSIARETTTDIDRHVIDSFLGDHFRRRGEQEKAAELLTRASRDLGELGAKFDVARARLSLAKLLSEARMARNLEDRQREIKLARSNLFEARRLFELMGANPRLAECLALEAKLEPEKPAAASE